MSNELQSIQSDDSQIRCAEPVEVVLYQPDETISLEVKLEQETVWLNRQQMAELFGRDVKTIGKHINNALREELAPEATGAKNATVRSVIANNATTQHTPNPVVAKFATTATDGKTYQVEYYNLDVILSVGYRVKSNRGIQFRRWANTVLKDFLLRGYTVSNHLVALQQQIDNRFVALEQKAEDQQQQVDFLVRIHHTDDQRLFPTGCVFDAWEHISALVRTASVLQRFHHRNQGVTLDCYVKTRFATEDVQEVCQFNVGRL